MSNTIRCLFAAALLVVGLTVDSSMGSGDSGQTINPYLSVEYRLVEAGTDKLAKTLQVGQQYDLLLTLKADQREGDRVKINPLFHTQQAQLQIIDKRVKYAAEPRTRQEKRNPQSRTVRVDPKTGNGKFTIALADGDKLAAKDVRLKLVADLMVCDDKGTYCAKTREEALLVLPVGKDAMKPLPLQFNAGNIERVVLKVGDKAPDFTATSAESKEIRISDYRGKKNLILLFGRAHW